MPFHRRLTAIVPITQVEGMIVAYRAVSPNPPPLVDRLAISLGLTPFDPRLPHHVRANFRSCVTWKGPRRKTASGAWPPRADSTRYQSMV